jgi:hypothetical protein
MKRLIGATVIGMLLGGTVLAASPAQSKGKKHDKKDVVKVEDTRRSDTHVGIHVVFAKGDVIMLRNYYAPRYRNLPPGLQKKVARGGKLPPGWQKKFEPFPVTIEHQLAQLPEGYGRGVIDGHAVIYNSRTNVVVDLAVLF